MYVWMYLQREHKLQETVQGEKKKHNKCAFIEIKKLPHVNSKLWFFFFLDFMTTSLYSTQWLLFCFICCTFDAFKFMPFLHMVFIYLGVFF